MEALKESVLPAPCVSAVVSVSISFGGARQQRSETLHKGMTKAHGLASPKPTQAGFLAGLQGGK